MERLAYDSIQTELAAGDMKNWSALKRKVIDSIQPFIYSETGRRPMILPIVMTV
jgi:ribonuclease J